MTLLLHTQPREHPVNHAEPIWSIAKDRHTTARYTRQGNKKTIGEAPWNTPEDNMRIRKSRATNIAARLFRCWTNGTRTHNDRTKTCSVTITPWSNTNISAAKVVFFYATTKF